MGRHALLSGANATLTEPITDLPGAQRIDAWVRPVVGVVLLLAGLNDAVTYWLL